MCDLSREKESSDGYYYAKRYPWNDRYEETVNIAIRMFLTQHEFGHQ